MRNKMLSLYLGAKSKFQQFKEQEKGGAEIIATVVVIAIVLVLAGVFWSKISAFFDELWTNVTGKDPTVNVIK